MIYLAQPRRPLYGTIVPLALLIIIADQLTKAYFVWLLADHSHNDLLAFAKEYFTLWASHSQGAVTANYSVLAGANHSVFKPLIWVWEPWISWNLTTNTGAAWSLLAGNSYALSFVSLFMATALFLLWYFRFRFHAGMTWALGAIVGGALGNFLDRFRLHEVVDFIDVRIPFIGQPWGTPYDFPIFNIADASAVCGTLVLATYLVVSDLRSWRARRRDGKPVGFKPLEEGLRLDDAAKARLRKLAALQPRTVIMGLTIHVAAPASNTENDANARGTFR
jgi:signal peptidase II